MRRFALSKVKNKFKACKSAQGTKRIILIGREMRAEIAERDIFANLAFFLPPKRFIPLYFLVSVIKLTGRIPICIGHFLTGQGLHAQNQSSILLLLAKINMSEIMSEMNNKHSIIRLSCLDNRPLIISVYVRGTLTRIKDYFIANLYGCLIDDKQDLRVLRHFNTCPDMKSDIKRTSIS